MFPVLKEISPAPKYLEVEVQHGEDTLLQNKNVTVLRLENGLRRVMGFLDLNLGQRFECRGNSPRR